MPESPRLLPSDTARVPPRPMRVPRQAVALLLACFAASLWAGQVDIWITQDSPLQQAFVDTLAPALADAGHEIGAMVRASAAAPTPGSGQVVVALGLEAAESAIGHTEVPVLAALISRRDAQRLIRDHGTERIAAIVLDQPVERRLRLLKHLLPGVDSVVVLLGHTMESRRGELESAVRDAGLEARVAVVRDQSEIVGTLERLLDPRAALLTIPDPAVYNRDTVMGILLTTYRHRRPVIGFTAAYVRAGAVAAVFSEPQDIARQSARLLTAGASLEGFRRGLHAPAQFHVAINERVSRSLGLPPQSELDVLERLRAQERAE